jgi:hypothetical protein
MCVITGASVFATVPYRAGSQAHSLTVTSAQIGGTKKVSSILELLDNTRVHDSHASVYNRFIRDMTHVYKRHDSCL